MASGFWTHRQTRNPAANFVLQLDKAKSPVDRQSELAELEATAKSLYEQGNLEGASLRCDDILQRDPQNTFALNLKERIGSQDIRPHRSDTLAQNNHQRTQSERVSTAGGSGSQPKQLAAASAGVTLAPSRNLGRKESAEAQLYSVIHVHFLGSCRGRLTISRQSIAYEPSEDKRHGFLFKLTDIVGTELGDTLKIKCKNETYRFKAGSTEKGGNRAKLAAIDQRLTKVRAEVAVERH